MLDKLKTIGCICLGIGGVLFILGAIFFIYKYFTVVPEYEAFSVALYATSVYFLLSVATLASGVVVLFFKRGKEENTIHSSS
jgi:hypothetical protein